MDETLHNPEQNYYLNLREFKSGEFEAILKAAKPSKIDMMNASMNGTSYAAACKENGVSIREIHPIFKHAGLEQEKSSAELQQNLNRAVRRSKQNIRWLCKAMEADRLFTLTYRENQIGRDQTRADFQRFLRLVRSGWRGQVGIPDWQYVAVLEKQDRGAFHIHCAVKGFQKIKFLRACWYKALGCSPDVTGENTPGAVNVTNPDKARWGHTGREWKVNKLAGYLTKYLSKTFDDSSSEKRRYWHCKAVTQPVKQRFWVSGSDIVQAIKSTINLLGFHVGLKPSFNHWLSTSLDSYWIAGQGDSGGLCL
jgi:hypothetical protein